MTSSYDSEQEPRENCDELAACNHTELYQLCIHAKIPVSPDMPKGTLLALLDGDIEITSVSNPVNDLRDGLMEFILQRWKRLNAQLGPRCPARSGDPKSCYQCVDAQVLHCLISNPGVEASVTEVIRRKKQV